VTVIDLDPSNTVPCTGTVRITHDNATFMHGFTNEFPVTFPLSTNAPACPPGAEITAVGIDLDIPDIVYLDQDNSAAFPVSASFVPDDEEIPGVPQWSVSNGSATPESGSMETWVEVVFPAPEQQAMGAPALTGAGAGAATNDGPPSVEVEIGDRRTRRTFEPYTEDGTSDSDEDPDSGEDPWDGKRFIARSYLNTEPVELTYALAHSSNAVGFAWHGHHKDTVLEWSISRNNGPRFVKDGQEVSAVTRDFSVAVLPRGEVSNFKIRAKVRTETGVIITRQTELRVITVVAEPVMSFDPGAPVNPCGLFVNDSATFKVEFSSNVNADDVQWSVANGNAALALAPQSTAPQTVVGLAPGTEKLMVSIAHFVDSPPQFTFEVYPYAAPIPVHFMFICDSSGNHVGSTNDIPGLLDDVNHIYRQAGLRFSQASISYTNDNFWYDHSNLTIVQRDIVNAMQRTGGLEVYIVPNLGSGVLGCNHKNLGLLLTGTSLPGVLAHEIGHQCGWQDIYISRPALTDATITGSVSKSRLPFDWNNGPGPQEYYPRGLQHSALITRLLMFGAAAGGTDIPAGPIHGLDKHGVAGPVQTGVMGMNRTPSHE
jgi:hypothetical protein